MSDDNKKKKPTFNRIKARDQILDEMLSLVPFDGWNEPTLTRAAQNKGYSSAQATLCFPRGVIDVVSAFSAACDAQMVEALEQADLKTMRIRDRITFAVRARIECLEDRKEAVRRAANLLALPMHAATGAKLIYRTVDAIWRGIGDQSTDFNFYSKRGLLTGVYSSTLLYWFNDETENAEATWDFLDRRIGDVMKIEKAKSQAKKILNRLPTPFSLFDGLSRRGAR